MAKKSDAVRIGFIGSGAWTLMRSGYDSQYGLMNQNSANSTARQAIDYLADHPQILRLKP